MLIVCFMHSFVIVELFGPYEVDTACTTALEVVEHPFQIFRQKFSLETGGKRERKIIPWTCMSIHFGCRSVSGFRSQFRMMEFVLVSYFKDRNALEIHQGRLCDG